MLQSILGEFNPKGPWSIYYICVQFLGDGSKFTEVTATADIEKNQCHLKSRVNFHEN